VFGFNPWNDAIEPGDLLVNSITGKLFRATESTGRDKRDSGELTPREIKPPHDGLKAKIYLGEVYWVTK
jgi:hypothetical protein